LPGMHTGVRLGNPAVVAAFTSALVHQGMIALLVFACLAVAWIVARGYPGWHGQDAGGPTGHDVEPAWRQVLRVGFGLLWVFDGILQAQPHMVLGLPDVIEAAAANSPRWVMGMANWAAAAWWAHPLRAAEAAVWIQIGIGIWMVAASRGVLSRLAGLTSAGWALLVWMFGESFGGTFGPRLTWMSGAPGAALVYLVAGALVALPARASYSRRLGRRILAGFGVFLLAMGTLQAWPGRGFWQGTVHGRPGALAGITRAMASTPQPDVLRALVTAFTRFDEAHAFAVNMFAAAALIVVGLAFVSGRRRLIRAAIPCFMLLCFAAWTLIEDLGIFGGLGTDPNSMVPMALVVVSGYLALARPPAIAGGQAEPVSAHPPAASWPVRLRAACAPRSIAAASIGSVASGWAIGLIIFAVAGAAAPRAGLFG
jgi:hypothetical protein